jgi:hypothetical protein
MHSPLPGQEGRKTVTDSIRREKLKRRDHSEDLGIMGG